MIRRVGEGAEAHRKERVAPQSAGHEGVGCVGESRAIVRRLRVERVHRKAEVRARGGRNLPPRAPASVVGAEAGACSVLLCEASLFLGGSLISRTPYLTRQRVDAQGEREEGW